MSINLTRFAVFRELGISLLGVAVLLGGAELALRSEFAFNALPVPRPYYTYDVSRRLHYLDRLERDAGNVDVLFVGSSAVRADIQPSRFDAAVRKRSGRRIVSFNGGFSKMYPAGAKLYLQHVWLDAAHPRFVLHGVREAELSSQAGVSYLSHGEVESDWLSKSPWSHMLGALTQTLSLAQYRGTIRKAITRMRDGKPLNLTEPGELTTDARGYRAEKAKLADKRRHHSNRLWKYKKKPTAARYARTLPVLAEMHRLCEQAGAQYILVHLPEHPERFSGPYGKATFDDYEKRIRAWAAHEHVPFIDVTAGDLSVFQKDELYSDFHHMSPAGAAKFTNLLGDLFARYLGNARRGNDNALKTENK